MFFCSQDHQKLVSATSSPAKSVQVVLTSSFSPLSFLLEHNSVTDLVSPQTCLWRTFQVACSQTQGEGRNQRIEYETDDTIKRDNHDLVRTKHGNSGS